MKMVTAMIMEAQRKVERIFDPVDYVGMKEDDVRIINCANSPLRVQFR